MIFLEKHSCVKSEDQRSPFSNSKSLNILHLTVNATPFEARKTRQVSLVGDSNNLGLSIAVRSMSFLEKVQIMSSSTHESGIVL
jgi:hypothetical protein